MALVDIIVNGEVQTVRKRSIAHRMSVTVVNGLVEGKLESEGKKPGGRPRKTPAPVQTKDAAAKEEAKED